jgi:hypothetical protein
MKQNKDEGQKTNKKGIFGAIKAKVAAVRAKIAGFDPQKLGGFFIKLLLVLTAFCVLSAVVSIFVNIFNGSSIKTILGEFFGGIISAAVLVGFLFMIRHILTTLSQEDKFKIDYSLESFREQRLAAGESENSSEEENEKCRELLQQMRECWTDTETTDGETYYKPNTMKEINTSKKLVLEVIGIAPTNPEIVDDLTYFSGALKTNTDRHFDGSTFLLGLTSTVVLGFLALIISQAVATIGYGDIVQGITTIIGGLILSAVIWGVPVGIYFLACRAPYFLAVRRKPPFITRVPFLKTVIPFVIGVAFTVLGINLGENTKWYNVYSDGRKERDYSMEFNNVLISLFLKAVIIGFFLMVVFFAILFLSLSVILWALVNFLRNYVIYK